MNILLLALKGLKEIIDNKKSFHMVMLDFKNQYNFSADNYSIFSKTLQGCIRHFFLLRYQATNLFSKFEEDDDEIYLICLAIYQLRYLRKDVSSFKVIEDVKDANDVCLLRLKEQEIQEKLDFVSKNKFNLPVDLLKDVYKYDSLTFSTPLWLVKLWAKEYGDDVLLNLLHTNRNKRPQYLQVNTLKAKKEELLSENLYQDISLVDNGLIYTNLNPLHTQDDFKLGKVYPLDLSKQIILEKMNFNFGDRILHLHSLSGGLTSYLGCKLKEYNGSIDTNFENEILYRKARYSYQRLGLDNVNSYLADIDMLRTYLSYNSYDQVYLTPKSSLLGRISKIPGLLLTIRKNEISEFVDNQYAQLIEADKYLKVNGQLIYIVFTINLEETSQVIDKFIKEKENYRIIEAKQIFPYDNNSDGAYYAILEKGE